MSNFILIYCTYQTTYSKRECKIYVGVCAILFTFHVIHLSLYHHSVWYTRVQWIYISSKYRISQWHLEFYKKQICFTVIFEYIKLKNKNAFLFLILFCNTAAIFCINQNKFRPVNKVFTFKDVIKMHNLVKYWYK